MILPFEQYNPNWKEKFNEIKSELTQLLLPLKVSIEHIGSTSVEGLSAKPIIDIMIGVENESELDKIPPLLQNNRFVYYEKYNVDMPYRRYFVLLKDSPINLDLPGIISFSDEIPVRMHNHDLRIAHIHVIPKESENFMRHIAFRDYLRAHPNVTKEYQTLKENLIKQEWRDGNEYNDGKDDFIKLYEKLAIDWYLNL